MVVYKKNIMDPIFYIVIFTAPFILFTIMTILIFCKPFNKCADIWYCFCCPCLCVLGILGCTDTSDTNPEG